MRIVQPVIWVLCVGVVAGLLMLTPTMKRVDLQIFDLTLRTARDLTPQPGAGGVTLIGIDEETVAGIEAPMALWHESLAQLVDTLSAAGARVAGFDLVLPERSYDRFLGRDNDRVLAQSILSARRQGLSVFFGRTLSDGGQLYGVLPRFQAVLGRDGFGMVLQVQELDAVVRRFYDDRYLEALGLNTLVGQMARASDVPVTNGWIDYAVGDPVEYVSMQEVLALAASGDRGRLQSLFQDQVVFVGVVLPFEDRHLQPLVLAGWENNRYAPGVLIHLQAYRALAADRMLPGVPAWVYGLVMALGAALVLVRDRPLITLGLLVFTVGAALAAAWLTFAAGWRFSPLPMMLAASCGWLASAFRDAWANLKEKQRMRSAFGGYVSPQILSEILSGNLTPDLGGEDREICLLFADLIGFTSLSESEDAERVLTLLNRYFDRVTPAIHHFEGTLDKYMGDGIMAFFGAPKALANPAQAGFDAARDMLKELDVLNEELAAEGIAPLNAGVGLGIGRAIVGHVGARSRFEYSAIGDAVNVSARIEGLTRGLNCRIALTDEVAGRLREEDREQLKAFGTQNIKGHTAIGVWGWGTLNADAPVHPKAAGHQSKKEETV
ncbi:MAG: adenylate/guanylate cyclase domain-containing protein [Pseudomonadota bacterium]